MDKCNLESKDELYSSDETMVDNNIKSYLNYLIRENLEDKLVESNHKGINFFEMKIKFDDLID